jgi:hypothetical protein
VLGSAVHETFARALLNKGFVHALLREHEPADPERVRATLEQELRLASDGRQIDWGREDAAELIDERVAMVVGGLNSMRGRVRRIRMVEAGFTVELEGFYQAGHVDLVYEPVDARDCMDLGLLDWKTGASKPDPIELDHGWEAGIYSLALNRGSFLPRELVRITPAEGGGWIGQYIDGEGNECAPAVKRSTRWQAERDGLEAALAEVAAGHTFSSMHRFERFPSRIHLVHLADFVPYVKAAGKEVKRDEDVEHYGVRAGTKIKTKAGDMRGPGWLPIRRKENDIPRLAYRLRTVVGTVRMGRFLDLVGEKCRRCSYKTECLNGGYAPRGEELAELERTLREAGV